MRSNKLLLTTIAIISVNSESVFAADSDVTHPMKMDMSVSAETSIEESGNMSSDSMEMSVNDTDIVPQPWGNTHVHGMPILMMKDLTPAQRLYWEAYNTTTYFTVESNYKSYLYIHLALLFASGFFLYPFVLIFNNLKSNWYLPMLAVQSLMTIVSCFAYSIFINNVPDLFPNMAYTKMVLGLFIFTVLQVCASILYSVKNWLYPSSQITFSTTDSQQSSNGIKEYEDNVSLQDLHSPSSPTSTLYDDDEENFGLGVTSNTNHHSVDPLHFDLQEDQETSSSLLPSKFNQSSIIKNPKNMFLETLSSIPLLSKLAYSFGSFTTLMHNLTLWSLFFYFLILLPTGVACLNLLGQKNKIFNLLAHWIKGGVFFYLGVLSLARYCGAFAGMGGSWNYAFVDVKHKNSSVDPNGSSGFNGTGSGGSNISSSLFIRFNKILNDRLLLSFEFLESFLIFFYGTTNVFLEHLASAGGAWSAKDLQHVSIAFMYFGAGLCGLITEFKLSNWRLNLFQKVTGRSSSSELENKLVSPGFSPNPFPVFTIFWTGLLMSKHAQASALATAIHVQWGSLLTYGSFFRIFTFFLMTYTPISNSIQCYFPSKPLTELITSFCLLCGGLVFMESTDQVIEALAYRGLTPMFTINISVGIVSLIMAWIMLVFAIKDKLKQKSL